MNDSTISVDEFQALEQKVLRAIEVVRREREARAAVEAEVVSLRELLNRQASEMNAVRATLQALHLERDGMRQRVEKMVRQMDELL